MDRNDLISRSELIKEMCVKFYTTHYYAGILNVIYNAPAVTPDKIQALMSDYLIYRCEPERPQGEWVRKEDIIHSIAKQYSEHNELVPIWLSIGDLKGGADMRQDNEPDRQITIEEYIQSLKGEN